MIQVPARAMTITITKLTKQTSKQTVQELHDLRSKRSCTKELFRILTVLISEQEQKFDKAGGGGARERKRLPANSSILNYLFAHERGS